MDPSSSRWKNVVAVLVAVGVAIGAFFAGSSYGAGVTRADYQAERDLDILLNRSELKVLDDVDGTIYVSGHKNPDSDTVGSSIAYATMLKKLGYDAQPVIPDDINNETEYILDAADIEVPEFMVDVSGENMILVDHSEYTQAADGMEDANIVAIIDHHGDGNITTSNQLVYDSRPLGSTATIIWINYRNFGVDIDSQTALVMMGSILSDTTNLQSDSTTQADREAVKALSELADVEDVDSFYRDMFKASVSHEGMTDEEIFFSDYKEYESAKRKFSIGFINVYDKAEAEDMAKRMKALVPTTLASTGVEMAFAQVGVFHDDISITYLVPSDEAAKEVLEAAFGDQGTWDGTSYVIEPGVSRRQVVVPAISEVLAAHPTE